MRMSILCLSYQRNECTVRNYDAAFVRYDVVSGPDKTLVFIRRTKRTSSLKPHTKHVSAHTALVNLDMTVVATILVTGTTVPVRYLLFNCL
jgi:hypothetical protein